MKNLYIPEPCSENWETMSPQEKGRFCSVCNKCVIDFTQKNPQEIRQIMDNRGDVKICGRFYNNQLDISDSSEKIESRFFKYIPSGFQNNRMLISIFSFLLFLTGCSKPKPEVYATTGVVMEIEEDSSAVNNRHTMGEARIVESDSIAKISQKDHVEDKKKLKKK
ncbi:hypothetical protein F3J23_01240 [Chryseobacterium sp. Tr-659]|uniref:hypothetical protein n=1 Tax=Chryseobacterium sp. Tr-659 TaxID=2608340 RepID=UPI001423633B|nr:hypothetical protein [Chryseobacterium sp. Tr-659]NIF04050.1 hypothetical protein [Chryseobacterium sp. Tr-659]